MPYLDRDSFIDLLDRLGDSDDARVLDAARELHRRVRDAGVTWDVLLAPIGVTDDDNGDNDDGDNDNVADDIVANDGGDGPASVSDTSGDAARLHALLDRHDLLDDTREDLEDMLEMIEDGEFTEMDRRYVKALESRLSKRRSGRR